jgi:hypothetical protein
MRLAAHLRDPGALAIEDLIPPLKNEDLKPQKSAQVHTQMMFDKMTALVSFRSPFVPSCLCASKKSTLLTNVPLNILAQRHEGTKMVIKYRHFVIQNKS